jgi:hypothetical protein
MLFVRRFRGTRGENGSDGAPCLVATHAVAERSYQRINLRFVRLSRRRLLRYWLGSGSGVERAVPNAHVAIDKV